MSLLESYLADCRVRLRRRFVVRGLAVLVLVALAFTFVFTLLFVLLVPGAGLVLAARIALYTGILAGIAVLLWWPLDEDAVIRLVEARVPRFDGRLRTWRDVGLRQAAGGNSALFALLNRETQVIADANDKVAVLPNREIIQPLSVAVIAAFLALVYMMIGTSPWQLAAQHLWTGDLFAATTPRITIKPGDTVVPRGTDVVIEAQIGGFVAQHMDINAAFENTSGWESAPMTRLSESKYGFVFVAVTEQVEYYTTAARLNSKRHIIHVADLPRVTDVELSLQYPEWAGLPIMKAIYGDVSALKGTRVQITATTDIPVTDPLIVVNGEELSARTQNFKTYADFEIEQTGSWYVAVRHQGALARISDTFLINVVQDKEPAVTFSWPGHDRQATSIEEVPLRFRAKDDFGVESLALHYSVNGGPWVEVALDSSAPEAEHLLYLEDLQVSVEQTGDIEPGGADETRSLKAGDMISFYGHVRDYSQQARSALYFVDIRPFDRTYRESQQGGSGSGSPGFEIAQRQREIVSATWNLINATKDKSGQRQKLNDADNDRADVLAMLQRTLKDQVLTLTDRVFARRLDADGEIVVYTKELDLAAGYMEPAAQKLELRALEDAIRPEQKALQHLLAAEASLTEVDVSRGSSDGRGTAGQSLSELIDLEMDPERNRYETPQTPGFDDESPTDNSEWARLEELASRQQQLAARKRNNEETIASRWQQVRLQRELENLRQRLEQQRLELEDGSQSAEQQAIDNAIAELNKAGEAMQHSFEQAEGNTSGTRRATQALRRAADQIRAGERQAIDQRLARTGDQVGNLLQDQRHAIEQLAQLEREIISKARGGERAAFNNFEMLPFAGRKKRMQADLNKIAREISDVGDLVRDRDPDTQRILGRALSELAENQVNEHLVAAAEAFYYGRPLFAVGSEATVERALQQLGESISEARQQLRSSGTQPQDNTPLARVRGLSRSLDDTGQDFNGLGGRVDEANAFLRATNTLARRLELDFGEALDLDTSFSRMRYLPRGTSAENTEALIRLTRDRLDLIEARLLSLKSRPIRAQKARDLSRDSEQAARYFHDLSAQQR